MYVDDASVAIENTEYVPAMPVGGIEIVVVVTNARWKQLPLLQLKGRRMSFSMKQCLQTSRNRTQQCRNHCQLNWEQALLSLTGDDADVDIITGSMNIALGTA